MSQPLGIQAVTALQAPWISVTETLVTVNTDATLIPTTPLSNRKGIWLHNIGTTNCFIAFRSGIGTSNEVILYPGQDKVIPATDQINVYGRVSSGTATIRAWEYIA